ncbi:hypothetical protein P7K49_014801 [Saguinus oedipus]|uniref:Uncharacterized protein n=1 Tax=Saguinus oedipus TaxID=9490 RepID=A0ABQ9V7E6_SAGOE|nr:hypothetical protein P7K49_014801 [Saguinus oedipus]
MGRALGRADGDGGSVGGGRRLRPWRGKMVAPLLLSRGGNGWPAYHVEREKERDPEHRALCDLGS